MEDIVDLGMVDFNEILRMDWLHSYYATLDCRIRKVTFCFHNQPVIEWERYSIAPKKRFIYYHRACNMISKGCLYHLIRVKDYSTEILFFS